MRKFILFFAALFSLGANAQDNNLNGSYKIIKAYYGNANEAYNISGTTIVKIFKNGYWLSAFFGNSDKPFDGAGGGTYKLKDDQYIEKLNFFSWDSTAVGSAVPFTYKLDGDNFSQDGLLNTGKYHNYTIKEEYKKILTNTPLLNDGLEGVWFMQSGDWANSKLGEGIYKNVSVMKIYSYPRFAFAYYDSTRNSFVGAGGGTYQFDGKKLSENLEYWSWGTPKYPKPDFAITISGDEAIQKGWDNGLAETWKKVK